MASLRLPRHLRKKLKKPLGHLIPSVNELEINSKTIICIGDKTSEEILKKGIKPKLCVYDGKIKRKSIEIPDVIKKFDAKKIEIKNPPGSLTEESFNAVNLALKSESNFKIKVDGEEDLIALAAIDLAPLNSLVLYGQPDEGVVVVPADNKNKIKVKGILKEMKSEENEDRDNK
ncbi:MAG: hypothetical protein A7315_04015 [Candidatus Altiarchaeales archaeon WOR_SM1_79]|nr:MAG: hypothetical protein A7315_04015 [Candidatus Altiarchaeales archaeon WOR_SM1_79]